MTKSLFVLIVEDNTWLAEQYVRTLEAAGIVADYVTHAAAAIEAIDVRRPDALLLDFMVPGGNIFVLLHELRSHADLAVIPIILCTNSADLLAGEDLASYGVGYVLDKTTMEPNDIIAAVKRLVL